MPITKLKKCTHKVRKKNKITKVAKFSLYNLYKLATQAWYNDFSCPKIA